MLFPYSKKKHLNIMCTYSSYRCYFLIIKCSKHAREQMVVRGITENEVQEGIQRGSKELQKPDKILSHYKYFCVVYKKINDVCFVITVKPR